MERRVDQQQQGIPLPIMVIEKKLLQLLTLNYLIDVPVESPLDWKARQDCQSQFFQIDAELQAANIHYHYSKRAGRFLYERYRLIGDGRVEGSSHQWIPCWTLVDTHSEDGKKTVVIAPSETIRPQQSGLVHQASPALQPVLLRVPMRTKRDRERAEALCERWNLAAAWYCPGCAQPLPEEERRQEVPYQNRAEQVCFACWVAADTRSYEYH